MPTQPVSRRTVVAVHAHPDDEALLTAGTMAALAAAGHRVVLVVCTDGALGLASRRFGGPEQLAAHRRAETDASAVAPGVARVVRLGYADSGSGSELYPDPPGQRRFLRVPVAEAAEAVATVLREESADVVLSYDAHGGYGHRDHVRVHEVVARAATLAGTARLLEATAPSPRGSVYTRPRAITHRVDVRAHLDAKRASMRAHASQRTGGRVPRLLMILPALPAPLARRLIGHEWFVDPTEVAARGAGAPRREGTAEVLLEGLP